MTPETTVVVAVLAEELSDDVLGEGINPATEVTGDNLLHITFTGDTLHLVVFTAVIDTVALTGVIACDTLSRLDTTLDFLATIGLGSDTVATSFDMPDTLISVGLGALCELCVSLDTFWVTLGLAHVAWTDTMVAGGVLADSLVIDRPLGSVIGILAL